MKSGKKQTLLTMPERDVLENVRYMRFAFGESLLAGFSHKKKYKDFENFRNPTLVLVLVLNGRGRYVDSQQREYPLSAGSLFFRIPGVEHSNYVDTDSDYLECYLDMGPELARVLNVMNIVDLASPVRRISGEFIREAAERVWQTGMVLNNSAEYDLSECLTNMISSASFLLKKSQPESAVNKYSELIHQACRELNSDFQKKFSLQKFCRRHSVGYENFRKQFRAQTGCSPWQYRIRCRMDAAEMLLKNQNLSIREIADLLGYNNSYEFSAQFKLYKKISPGQYRSEYYAGE